jgi:predicted dehydrogenase
MRTRNEACHVRRGSGPAVSGAGPWAPAAVTRDGAPGQGLRVAVAGASHWHLPRHAAHLSAAGATFAAVSDPDATVARRWAERLGCPAVPQPAALVELRPDLVLALGRVSDMAAQAGVLLGAGIALLAEKPLGLDAAQVAAVDAAVREHGGWVSVALVQRYDPLWGLLDGLQAEGRLGAVAHYHVRIVNGPPRRYAEWGSGWMLDPATAGGGALLNLGIHGVDAFLHLVGDPPGPAAVQVTGAAVTARAHGGAVEDYGAVVLRAASGLLGTVEAGYTYPDASAGMTRAGDNEVRLGASGVYLIARDAAVWQITAEGGEEVLPEARAGDRYRDWVFDSLARFRAGRPPLAGVGECLAAVRLLETAYTRAGRPAPIA